MPYKSDREYRIMAAPLTKSALEGEEYIVEGYATTFDEPYVLFSDGENDYLEMVDRNAFVGTNMNDVIFQFDHSGMVYARNKNNTLNLSTDEHGLKVRAYLGSTEDSKRMYEAISSGLVDQMSFAFTVDDEDYDKATRTRIIKHVKKLFDVSAVSIPANPGTEISARSAFEGYIEAERLERAAAEARAEQIKRIKEICKEV